MKYSDLTIKEVLDILVGDDEKKKKEVKEVLKLLDKGEVKVSAEGKFKIRYEDTMTSYLLDETFDSEEEAYQFIDENFFEGDLQFYEVEVEDEKTT